MIEEPKKKSECDEEFKDMPDIMWWASRGKLMEKALIDKGMEYVPDES